MHFLKGQACFAQLRGKVRLFVWLTEVTDMVKSIVPHVRGSPDGESNTETTDL